MKSAYFFCIEALQQDQPGRYLYVDADTLCVHELSALEALPLDDATPLAASSHGRRCDRSLSLALESPYHYFNAGVMLFDAVALAKQLTPSVVVDYFLAIARSAASVSSARSMNCCAVGFVSARSVQPAELDA